MRRQGSYELITKKRKKTSKGKKHLKKMKVDVGMTKTVYKKRKRKKKRNNCEKKIFDLLSSLHQAYQWYSNGLAIYHNRNLLIERLSSFKDENLLAVTLSTF